MKIVIIIIIIIIIINNTLFFPFNAPSTGIRFPLTTEKYVPVLASRPHVSH